MHPASLLRSWTPRLDARTSQRSRHSIAVHLGLPCSPPRSTRLGQQAWVSQVYISDRASCELYIYKYPSSVVWVKLELGVPPSSSSTRRLCCAILYTPGWLLTLLVSLAGALQPGEVTPSPAAERKEWGPFGSPVELSAATASHKGNTIDGPPQEPFPAMAAPADAEATSAASAVRLEASTVSPGSATEQQQEPGSAQAQHLDTRPELEAEQEQRDQAEGPSQALPPENWPSGR